MPTVLEDLTARRDAEIDRLEELHQRDDFNPEAPEVASGKDQIADLNRSIKERTEWEQLKASSNQLTAAQARLNRDGESGLARRPAESLSLGEMFVRSDVFTQYPRRGSTPRMALEAPDVLLTRALPTKTVDWAAAIQLPPPRDITAPLPPTPLLDLIPAIPWASDVVNYITWAKTAGGAAIVGEGLGKPSAEFKPTATAAQMKTIAVWTEVTRQLLEAPAAVKSKIDGFLIGEVRRVAEAEAAAALTAATLPTAVGATLLEGIRVGIGTVQAAGYNPTAVLLNPADWATLDLSVFNATLNGPVVGQTFWGVRPVASTVQPAGTATVGDFSSAMERYVRSSVDVFITDSHAGNFILNVFTILAESRELTAVIRPSALVEVTKTP